MPRTKSARKSASQAAGRKELLAPVRTRMKTMLRKVADAAKAKDAAELTKLLPGTYKAVDMAAKKGVIHRKNADRKKALVAKLVAGAAK